MVARAVERRPAVACSRHATHALDAIKTAIVASPPIATTVKSISRPRPGSTRRTGPMGINGDAAIATTAARMTPHVGGESGGEQ